MLNQVSKHESSNKNNGELHEICLKEHIFLLLCSDKYFYSLIFQILTSIIQFTDNYFISSTDSKYLSNVIRGSVFVSYVCFKVIEVLDNEKVH